MKNTKWLMIAAGVVILFSLVFTFTGNESEVDYHQSVMNDREEKDQYFLHGGDSPLSSSDRQTFEGLTYYDIDEKFVVEAKLDRIENGEIITMPTSDQKDKKYRRFAYAHFTLAGKSLKLTLFQPMQGDDELLFMPFADETSAMDTYGAGRYLDFQIPGGDELVIDFNQAYNPYCAYSDKFSCPLPPRENYLAVAIEAGEKNYHN